MAIDAAWFEKRLTECGIPHDENLPARLELYLNLLTDWNTRMDLTAVLEPEEMADRHFIDSLTALTVCPELRSAGSLIDVGTGAGFPGLPLAMALPNLQVMLLDAQQKRLNFLQAVIDAAGIKNVRLVHSRAEDGAQKPELRESFDFAVARAVAPLNVLAEYLLPYVRLNGKALCWKGPSIEDEFVTGKKAAFLCGGKLGESIPVQIPGREWQHNLVPIEKVRPTPKMYPRKAGLPSKKPLGE